MTTLSYGNEGHAIFQLRRKKYTLTPDEIKILKDIFRDEIIQDEIISDDIRLNDIEFQYNEINGYKALAIKFQQKLNAIRTYNNLVRAHRIKKYFSVFYTKNTSRLETALTYINYHTKNILSLENVSSAFDYDDTKKHEHKLHHYNEHNSFLFTAKNLVTTLKNQAKRFLFISFGQIARLTDAFTKKTTSIQEAYKKEEISLKLNKKEPNSNKNTLLKNLKTNGEHILPNYPPQPNPEIIPEPTGIVSHEDLRTLLENATEEDKAHPSYNIIHKIFFRDLRTYELHMNADQLPQRNKYINYSITIIENLNKIITAAMPASKVMNDRHVKRMLDLPTNNVGYNFFDKVIDYAQRDINAIKGLAPYTRLLTFFENPSDKERRHSVIKSAVISPLDPALQGNEIRVQL